MSFSMLFCIVFTMGAVFFDCKWEKVPNLWIIAGLQISMAEHLSGEVIQGLGSAVIRFWGGIFLVLFLFFPLFLGKMIGTGDPFFFFFFAVTGGSGSYISFSIFSGHTLNDHFHRIWCRGKDRKIFILQYQF